MRSVHIKHFTSYLGFILLALFFISFLSVLPKDTAEAWSPSDCGVINNGNEHSYAGLVVRLYVQVNGGARQKLSGSSTSDMSIIVSTVGRTASPPGNILQLNSSGQEVPGSRAHEKDNFHPNVGGSCDGMAVVLGTPGHWAIDCDVSKNGDAQQIRVGSTDKNYIPSGYRNMSNYKQGTWEADQGDIKRPPNGGSMVYDLTYKVKTKPTSAQASAGWKLEGGTSVIGYGNKLVRRGDLVNFQHNFTLTPTWAPAPTPVRTEPTCTSNSATCLQRWATYNQYIADKNAADTVNEVNEKNTRNRDKNNNYYGFYIKKNWVLWNRDKAVKLFGSWGGENIVNNGVGGDRPTPYNVSVNSSSFNSSPVQDILAAGDTYCEYAQTTVKDSEVAYVNGNVTETPGDSLWFPGDCVTVRSEWSSGGNQNIERIDNNGVVSRGVGEVVSPTTTRNGDYTFSDVWVNEKYRINGWVVNNGPEFSDEPIAVRTQVTDNITGSYLDPANTFTTGYNIPAGTEMSPRLGYDILSGSQPIPADAAGKGVCQRTFWNSAFGDPNPNFNGNTPLACVYVPYFYHIKNPTLNRQGSTGPVQQGDSIQLQATARLPQTSDGSGPGVDNNGRHHTVSENVGWAIERSDDGGAWNAVAGHSGSRVWQPNNNVETINDPNTPVISGNDTYNMPIGKKVCFRLRIDKGSQDTGVIYSDPNCFTITKSPKIQVGNRDVLTGYGIPAGADDSCTTKPNSSVITTAAPTYVSSYPNKNLYGSWGEYGVFATGNITNFGSAAYDSSDAGAGKLRFSNQDSNGGYKSYGNPCTFNWFEKVGKKATDPSGDTFQVNDPVNAGKQVSHEGKIDVTAPGAAATTVEDTSFKNIKVSVFARDISSGIFGDPDIRVECPKLKITLSNSSTVNTGQWCTNGKAIGNFGESKDFDFVLNSSSYNPGKVTVQFINDASGPNGDRNIAIDTVTIKRVKDNTTAVIKAKDVDKSQRLSNGGQSCSNDSIVVSSDGFLIFHQDITQYGHCYGIDIKESDYLAPTTSSTPAGKVSNIASPPLTAIPPLTNSSSLPANKKATVIYAKSDDCSNPGDGVIYIKNNIEYDTNGYNIEQIPRVILLADCGIIIDKDVTNVDASLITRGTINTCSARQASNIPLDVTSANYALTKDDCNKPLKISGHILAKKVNLLRTYGADLTSTTGDPTRPAEDFTQNPIDFISTYRQSYQEVKLVPENEINLPPRY
jgi:hypothetical protein